MNSTPEGVHNDYHFKLSAEYFRNGVLSWLLPGAGHWLLGYRLRGAILAVGIIGLFWFGESALGGNMAVSRRVSPIFFTCQMGNGLSTLAAQYWWGEPRYENDRGPPDRGMSRYYHFGVLFTTVSGLLNMLAVLHVMDPDTWRQAKGGQKDQVLAAALAAKERLPQGGGGTT